MKSPFFVYLFIVSPTLSISLRNKILKSTKTTIYDETYNASPESVKACIDNLLDNPNNHFFIFGSMQELSLIHI